MKKMLILLGIMSVLASGCGLSEIKNERAATAEQSKAIVLKLVDAAKIDQTNLTARGEVKNPKYLYTWFGGTGVYSAGSIEAVGVELSGQAVGAGVGSVAGSDPDLRAKVYEILSQRNLSEIERREAINQAVLSWFASQPGKSEPETQPAE